MSANASKDIFDLARLAQQQDGDLRPLLLRVHSQRFVSALRRDRAMIAEYEALALGLIPLVPDDALAEVANALAPIPETPTRVAVALRNRLMRLGAAAAADDAADEKPTTGSLAVSEARQLAQGAALRAHEIVELLGREDPDIDLALAGNRRARLDGFAVRALVARARRDRALAVAILDRGEPGLFDRASLYGFADGGARDNLRLALAATPVAAAAAHASPSPALIARIVEAAEAGDLRAAFAAVAARLDLDVDRRWDLDDGAERELFVLALVAVGLTVTDVMRVVLTLDAQANRRDGAVFRLAGIARTTSRGVAILLAGRPDGALPARPARDDGERRDAARVKPRSERPPRHMPSSRGSASEIAGT